MYPPPPATEALCQTPRSRVNAPPPPTLVEQTIMAPKMPPHPAGVNTHAPSLAVLAPSHHFLFVASDVNSFGGL